MIVIIFFKNKLRELSTKILLKFNNFEIPIYFLRPNILYNANATISEAKSMYSYHSAQDLFSFSEKRCFTNLVRLGFQEARHKTALEPYDHKSM